ncbi:MAG: putative porin [Bacteroidales bacterium]|nr:putative porin [Candidatus Colicola coprequi]
MRFLLKNSRICLLLLACFVVSSLCSARDKLPKTVVRAWRLTHPLALPDSLSVAEDTSYLNFPMRDVLYDYSILNHTNGNLVSPTQSAIYFQRTRKTDCLFANQYDPYTITPQDVRFYNTTTPYSGISYKKGFTTYHEANDLQFFFTGNFTPTSNFGMTINYLNDAGHYQSQAGKTVNGSVFGSYNGDHYSIQAAFTFNTLSNFENGGLMNMDDLINGSLESDAMPTNIEAMSGFRYLSGYINHYYSICTEREEKVRYRERDENGKWQVHDSVRVNYVPVTTFRHVLDINEANRRYLEKNIPSGYYGMNYRNPRSTRDSASTLTIRNTFSVTFEEEFNTVLKFGATVYAYNEFQRHLYGVGQSDSIFSHKDRSYSQLLSTPLNLMPDTICKYSWSNNTFVGGELYKNRGKYVFYGFGGDVCLVGRKIGDFQINGYLNGHISLGKDTMHIAAKASFHRETPDFYYSYYNSNHFRWRNDSLKALYRLHIGGELSYPTRWIKPALGVNYENITNYLYFEGFGAPIQSTNNISVLSADVKLNITTPWVNMDNNVVYQYSSSSAIPLPTIALYSNLYYHGVWFKALDAQIGVDLKYNTSYYAPVLNPATGQFCVQDQIKVGNYPVMSVYANFFVRLIRLRFFAQYQHFNASFMNRQYFSMPYYPLNPDVFRAGLAFHFYN